MAASSAQSRSWVFTLNNPTEDSVPVHPKERYCVYQLEAGSTPHFQGYIELTAPCRLSAMKKWLPTAHFENRRGTPEEARAYCMKDETRLSPPVERGKFKGEQGKRTDLAAVAEMVQDGATMKEVAAAHPEAYIKFNKGILALKNILKTLPRDEGFVPRTWQKEILDIVIQDANDREIVWIYDQVGNAGKSRFVRHLLMEHGATQLAGKVADMAYQYDEEPVVCFDITRTQAGNMDHLYSFAEALKNGVIVSTKYETKMKVFKAPHVIFFSNSLPDMTAWSKDRYRVFKIVEDIISPMDTDELIAVQNLDDNAPPPPSPVGSVEPCELRVECGVKRVGRQLNLGGLVSGSPGRLSPCSTSGGVYPSRSSSVESARRPSQSQGGSSS